MSDYSWCMMDENEGRWVPVEASDVPMLKMLREENERMKKYVEVAQINIQAAYDDKEFAEKEAQSLRDANEHIGRLATQILAKLSQTSLRDDTSTA